LQGWLQFLSELLQIHVSIIKKNFIMRKIISALFIVSMLATACTKHNPTADNGIISAARNGTGVEDNPNGGGGNNVATVPAAVTAAFNARYPDATNIQWKKLSDGSFKAEFNRGTVKWQATFTAAGVLLKEEHQ
jgi:hypothetical protein